MSIGERSGCEVWSERCPTSAANAVGWLTAWTGRAHHKAVGAADAEREWQDIPARAK